MYPTLPSADGAFPLWRSVAAVVGSALVLIVAIAAGILVLNLLGRMNETGTGSLADTTNEAFAYAALACFLAAVLPRLARAPLGRLIRMPTRSELLVALAAFGATEAFDLITTGVLLLTHSRHTQTGFEHFDPHGIAAQIGAFLVITVFAPFAEELLFRGLILNALAVRVPFVVAAIIVSILFGLVHGDAILFPSFFASAVVWAYAYRRTGNLAVTMLVHASSNAVGLFTP